MTGDIPERETLTVEFKSDRDRLSDRDLIAAVTCLANTEGGDIYLGVEDDGTVTGLHPAHRNLMGLTALIANLTSPPLTARVEAIDVERRRIAKISLPKRCARSWSGWWRRAWSRLMASRRDELTPSARRSTKNSDNLLTTSGRSGSTRSSRNRWSSNMPETRGESRGITRQNCAGSVKIKPAGYSRNRWARISYVEPERGEPQLTSQPNRAKIVQCAIPNRACAIFPPPTRFLLRITWSGAVASGLVVW